MKTIKMWTGSNSFAEFEIIDNLPKISSVNEALSLDCYCCHDEDVIEIYDVYHNGSYDRDVESHQYDFFKLEILESSFLKTLIEFNEGSLDDLDDYISYKYVAVLKADYAEEC